MAALAGAFYFDMRPTRELSAVLTAALATLAVDDAAIDCEPGIVMGLGACAAWTGSATRPIRLPSGLLATFDGRLDNRDDLLMQLRGPLDDGVGDAEIAAGAFEKWGIEGLARLTGEWAAAIWDPSRHTLHLARDYMGTRPLFYAASAQAVMWSSSLGELALRSGRRDALSERFIAAAVVREMTPDVTPYHGIHAVPAAACLSFAAGPVPSRQRHWSIASGRLRFRRDRDYDECLRAHWLDAVRSRLRTAQAVWAELSGGLDSSSVVCMADTLIRGGRVPATSMRLISHATLESSEGDERRFIGEIERRVLVRSDVLGVEAHQQLVDDEWDWVSPFAARGVGLACLRHVRAQGGRVLLSGRMGDAIMGCQPDNSAAVFDDLSDSGILTALAQARLWSRACRRPFVETCVHLLSEGANARSGSADAPAAGLLLLTRRLQLEAAEQTQDDDLTCVRRAKRPLARMLLGYSSASRFDYPLLPPGIVYAYPFTHRPLVEFMLAIPGNVLTAPGETRSLMRRSFAGLVPGRVLGRHSKGYYPPAALRGLRPLAATMLPVDRLEVVRRGWIDPSPLEAALHVLIAGGSAGPDLRRVLRLEHWLQSRQRRGPAVPPTRKEVRTNGVLNA